MGQILTQLNARPKGGLPSDMVINPMNDAHKMVEILVNMFLRFMKSLLMSKQVQRGSDLKIQVMVL